MSTAQVADRERIEALILYIAEKSEREPRFGKTKLNKLLFYSDSIALGMLGRPITGWPYLKDQFGPVPLDANDILDDLVAERRLGLKRAQDDRRQVVPEALVPPPVGVLTKPQMDLVDLVLDAFWEHGAVAISEFSHLDLPGWEQMANGHFVPLRPMTLPVPAGGKPEVDTDAAIEYLMEKNADLMRRLA